MIKAFGKTQALYRAFVIIRIFGNALLVRIKAHLTRKPLHTFRDVL
jgi:hypothetical protein